MVWWAAHTEFLSKGYTEDRRTKYGLDTQVFIGTCEREKWMGTDNAIMIYYHKL